MKKRILKLYLLILLIFTITLLLILTFLGKEEIIGGDKDEYGCLVSAGYQWCPSTEKCQRMWEEYCVEFKEQFKVLNFEDCVQATGMVMESYPRQCRFGDITYVEDLPGEKPKTYCTEDQRNSDSCITLYEPVCAFVQVQCITTPCEPILETHPNSCIACSNSNVIYYREGECQ